ncbi:hypothetical protein CDAR_472141 [Caerostris darwini]|uniref:Uncharacterized protein n=1 Tax=Caerostris darwini TaxID=1538125 RepID=A0AAV4VMS5_9ARAC|nr:hypothetical protein CDAR_472141 [Caerostris darwini]
MLFNLCTIFQEKTQFFFYFYGKTPQPTPKIYNFLYSRSEGNSLQQPRPPTEQSALWRGVKPFFFQRIKRNAAFIDEFGGGLAHPRSCSKCTSVFHVRKEPRVHFCSDAALLCGRVRPR